MKRGRIPSRPPAIQGAARGRAALSPKAQQLFDHGQSRAEAGDFAGAADAFSRVIELRPDVYQAHFNLGRALVKLERDAEALVALQRVLAIQPGHHKAMRFLAQLHKRRGNLAESIRLYQKAQQLDPLDATLALDLAVVLASAGREEEAMEAMQRALAIAPNLAAAHYTLGNIVRTLKGDAASVPHYARTVELDPDHIRAWISLGLTHDKSHPQQAARYYREALARDPDNLPALYGLLRIEQRYCDFDSTKQTTAQLRDALGRGAWRNVNWQTAANLVYESLFAPLPLQAIHALQDHIARTLEREVRAQGALPPTPPPSPATDRRLRIGYLSPSFGNHPVGQVTLSLFPAHNRQRFEVHAFSTRPGGADGSEEARIHREGFEVFHEIGDKTSREAAEYIRSQGIDILIDLDGYMDTTSPPILAFRPAALQAFWLGHAGGLGLPCVDYLIADSVVIPPGEESIYREAIARLPGIYHCADRHPIADTCPPRSEFRLPENAVVYCVFNNPDKINRQVFDCWMRILRQVEGSVLWFSSFRQKRDFLIATLRRYAEQQGVDPQRLILSERVPDKAGHLARIGHADLMLDTLTLNASTTALDSLWTGVPLLAVRGDRFSNRISNSMLHAVGLDDLVCADLAEYERRAIELGLNPAVRGEYRRRLWENRETTPLFDIEHFVRNLESAYEAMWQRHCRGEPPAGIDLPSP